MDGSASRSPAEDARLYDDDEDPRWRAFRRLESLATLLDAQYRLPGTSIRFGLDALIGLVPGIGDAATALASAYLIREARRLGLPPAAVRRMLANVAVELIIGAVPLAGDLFDVAWRANLRNVRILRRHLQDAGSGKHPIR